MSFCCCFFHLSLPFFLFTGFHVAQDSSEWSSLPVAIPRSRSVLSNLESRIFRARGDFPSQRLSPHSCVGWSCCKISTWQLPAAIQWDSLFPMLNELVKAEYALPPSMLPSWPSSSSKPSNFHTSVKMSKKNRQWDPTVFLIFPQRIELTHEIIHPSEACCPVGFFAWLCYLPSILEHSKHPRKGNSIYFKYSQFQRLCFEYPLFENLHIFIYFFLHTYLPLIDQEAIGRSWFSYFTM